MIGLKDQGRRTEKWRIESLEQRLFGFCWREARNGSECGGGGRIARGLKGVIKTVGGEGSSKKRFNDAAQNPKIECWRTFRGLIKA